jgi:hypothetical protein
MRPPAELSGEAMVSSLARHDAVIRIALTKPWWSRLFALPFLAAGLFFFWIAAMAVRDAATERINGNIDYLVVPLFIAFGLALTVPGVILLGRRFLRIDKSRGQVSRIFQIGPFKRSRDRHLSAFHVVSIIWDPDSDNRGGSYVVTLFGDKGADRIRINAFSRLAPALDLAREIGGALGLAVEDDSDAGPDDPDLKSHEEDEQSAPMAASASLRRPAARAGRAKQSSSLSRISIKSGKVGVLLPPPAFAPWLLMLAFGLNSAIWWLDWQAAGKLFELFSGAHSSGLSPRALALLPLTIAAALPLAAMAGMEEHLVFDKARRDLALVRKSAIINSQRHSALSSLATLTIEKRSGSSRTRPFTVSFLAGPGSRPRLLETFDTKARARIFADTIASTAGLQVAERV